MIYPNADCADYCDWLLNNSLQDFTSARKVQIQNIYNAAINGDPVTLGYYNQFVSYTQRWYRQYQMYNVFKG